MNAIIQSLHSRKSVRAYTDEPITPEEKKLILASKSTEAVFVADSEYATINGKEYKMRVPMTMRDGIPVFSLQELCEIFGFEYSNDNGKINVTAK